MVALALAGGHASAAYLTGSEIFPAVMIAAGVAEWLLGVDAERRSLEDVAKPLTAEEAETEPTA
jgi:hypothetical protein